MYWSVLIIVFDLITITQPKLCYWKTTLAELRQKAFHRDNGHGLLLLYTALGGLLRRAN